MVEESIVVESVSEGGGTPITLLDNDIHVSLDIDIRQDIDVFVLVQNYWIFVVEGQEDDFLVVDAHRYPDRGGSWIGELDQETGRVGQIEDQGGIRRVLSHSWLGERNCRLVLFTIKTFKGICLNFQLFQHQGTLCRQSVNYVIFKVTVAVVVGMHFFRLQLKIYQKTILQEKLRLARRIPNRIGSCFLLTQGCNGEVIIN